MKSFLKIIFNLSLVIKIRNFFNFRPVNIYKSKLNGKVSISDSFCWRTDNNLKTLIRFSDILKTFYNLENSHVIPAMIRRFYEAKKREDKINDGNYREDITVNAPNSEEGFFLVPKVID